MSALFDHVGRDVSRLEAHMRIAFRRRGGFAPTLQGRELVVDTATLAADEAAEVESLARQALQNAGASEQRPVADAFTYEVSIDSGDEQRTLVISERDVPEASRP